MPLQFTQEGGTSIRVEKDGVLLEGGHAQIHTALARAGREAASGETSTDVGTLLFEPFSGRS